MFYLEVRNNGYICGAKMKCHESKKHSNVCQVSIFDSRDDCMWIDKTYSCVVFIETYPEGEIPTEGAKGVRKTWLGGYSAVKEFYHAALF